MAATNSANTSRNVSNSSTQSAYQHPDSQESSSFSSNGTDTFSTSSGQNRSFSSSTQATSFSTSFTNDTETDQVAATTSNAATIAQLQSQLSAISLRAESIISQQPRSTYLALTRDARNIYRNYAQHGSQIRFSENIKTYLTTSEQEDVRRGIRLKDTDVSDLTDSSIQECLSANLNYQNDSSTDDSDEETQGVDPRPLQSKSPDQADIQARDPLKVFGNGKFPTPYQAQAALVSTNAFGFMTATRMHTERDLLSYTHSTVRTPPKQSEYSDAKACSASSSTRTNSLPYAAMTATNKRPLKASIHHTISPSSYRIISAVPFQPAHVELSFPANLQIPTNVLVHLNRTLNLYNFAANATLRHHETKYGPSPLIRLGISTYFQSNLDSLFESASTNSLGLNTATRIYFREVFERQPDLNIVEKRLLARSARVSIRTVEMWWEDMHAKRMEWFAMRAMIARIEIERGRKARRQEAEDEARKKREEKRMGWASWQGKRSRGNEMVVEVNRELRREKGKARLYGDTFMTQAETNLSGNGNVLVGREKRVKRVLGDD